MLGRRAQPPNLEPAERVGQSLCRPDRVTIHGHFRAEPRYARVVTDVGDPLLSRPPERIDTGVHDEQRGREGDVGQGAEPRGVGRVQAHLVGQLLGIFGPSLAEARRPEVAGDRRDRLPTLEGDRPLQVVTRNGLVERERLEVGP